MTYKAFISYSHAADDKLAPALQSALHRFAKPFYRLRAVRVFRDKTNLQVTPQLWPTIQQALAASEYFLLLASPAAARSHWVKEEVAEWVALHGSADKILLIATEGEIVWDPAAGDFDWGQTNALPPNLRGIFDHEPLYCDLRWARTSTDLSLRNPQFLDAVGTLGATLHGKPKDEMIGEDVRQNRLFKSVLAGVALLLLALTGVAIMTAFYAVRRRDEALTERNIAASRELASASSAQLQTDPQLSLLLALNAVRAARTDEAELALRQSLTQHYEVARMEGHTLFVTKVAFSPDGKLVVTGSRDETAHVWEAQTGQSVAELRGHAGDVGVAAFSPDGNLVVTAGGDGMARVWESGTWRAVLELHADDKWVYSACFSPDGGRILTAGADGVARVWDARTGRKLVEMHGHTGDPTRLILGEVVAAVFSPDGKFVATASRDHTARVWDAATGKSLAVLRGHKSELFGVEFSPDGKLIVTASGDGTARM